MGGTFSKELQLNFAGRPNVIRWRSAVELPSDTPFFDLEILTAYLTGDFTDTYDFDAEALTTTYRDAPTDQCSVSQPAQDAGGVVQTTPDGEYAFGIYRRFGLHAPSWFGRCTIGQVGDFGNDSFDAVKINVREARPTVSRRARTSSRRTSSSVISRP